MARPFKKGIDYFPFDIDFFIDEKISAISGEFGIKGEITVIKLLCAVYRNGYYAEWNDMLKYKLLKELTGISSELIEQIVQRLVKWDFFDKNLFNSEKILTSRGIQKRYFQAIKRRSVIDKFPYLLIDKKETTSVAQLHLKSEQTYSSAGDGRGEKLEYQFIADMKASPIWIEQMMMKYQITNKDVIYTRIDAFMLDCQCRAKKHNDLSDAKQHFCDWLRIQIENEKKKNVSNKQDNKNRRRGSVVSTSEKKDYNTSF
ncbi:DUF4373 domain-containing protein [Barnesiella propionica]|uniref:DUF4373 domain-containing protein n=1 Tax=Barnesiella propionica TaxID=2981781 RepID=UPI0011CC2756|nr:DUF4373 domain-containing protein [Barnesiella propionica]MCU6767380.1 DUF4373 domain-containing protein [Barnesiella propionica]